MYNLKKHKNSYIVAAVVLIAVVLGGLAYSGRLPGFDFSMLTGSATGGSYRGSTSGQAVPVQVTLSVSAVNNPTSDILVAGSAQQLVSRYSFRASQGDIMLNKLTIINDLSGPFGSPVNTNAVARVTIKYPSPLTIDANGNTWGGGDVLGQGILSNGAVTFYNLGFVIPKNTAKNIEIYADINSMGTVGQSLSGSNFRLGIRDTQNTAATFEAIAVSSNTSINPTFVNSSNVQSFTVRKSKPTFTSTPVSTKLVTGENTLYSLNVTANPAGSVSFSRFIYNVTTTGFAAAGADISNVHLYRGSTMMSAANVNIFCTNSGGNNNTYLQASGLGFDLCDGIAGNGIVNGTYRVIISFNVEETVSPGSTQVYYLKGTVSGAKTGSTIVTRISTGDDNIALTGLTANVNPNMGKIHVYNGPTSGIFTGGTSDFTMYLFTGKNIIWSDMSADAHSYPTVIINSYRFAEMTSGSGSGDWTNGYLLKTNVLPVAALSFS